MNNYFFEFVKVFFLKNFEKLVKNLVIIFRKPKMILFFLLILPIYYQLLKVQVFIGLFYFIYYLLYFIIYYFILNTLFKIKFNETYLNTSRLLLHSLFNVFVFVPQAKAFEVFYNILYFLKSKEKKFNYKLFLVVLTASFLFFLVKFSIFLLIGYSYFSISISSNFVVQFFKLLSFDYENNKAKIQHILLNCFLLNQTSINQSNGKKIFFDGDNILFNPWPFFGFKVPSNFIPILNELLFGFKDIHLLFESFKYKDCGDDIIINTSYRNYHPSFIMNSLQYPDKNLTKNLTHSKWIEVENELNEKYKVLCSDKFKIDLKGDMNDTYITNTYESREDITKVYEIPKNKIISMSDIKENILISTVIHYNDKIYYHYDDGFHYKENAPTVRDYAIEYKIPVAASIGFFAEFKQRNEELLSTEEGKKKLEKIETLFCDPSFFKNKRDSDLNDML